MSLLKTVVWERLNKTGKWCPYSADVCQLLEQSYAKNLNSVCLGDADMTLSPYSVNFKDMLQISETSGAKHPVRRLFFDENNIVATDVMWQWRGDHNTWQYFTADVVNVIENAYKEGRDEIDLSNYFPNYPYVLNFLNMAQKNKRTRYHRPIRRIVTSPYPLSEGEISSNFASDSASYVCDSKPHQKKNFVSHVNSLWSKLTKSMDSDSDESPKASGYKKQCTQVSHWKEANENSYMLEVNDCTARLYPDLSTDEYLLKDLLKKKSPPRDVETEVSSTDIVYATVNGKPWKHSHPPHTSQSDLKPVPGIEPLPIESNSKSKRKNKKKNVTTPVCANEDVITQFTELVSVVPSDEQTCIICCEPLSKGSSYDNDSTVIKLRLCSHMFHKSCIKAMYDSGSKDNCLQCPTCKTIHGIKCGIQPPGQMIYHVIPYSLPGYPECETIRIIYNIHGGTQGPEHPNPGYHYSARGFPRHCYLPDNETGRKILHLLIKAWERRLIFTIGTSSTTNEQNTVTWNEIHHKTEFGFNRRGHGYPDPHYFDNIMGELAAHGITESS